MNEIAIGKTGILTITVSDRNIASTLKSGALPVFATPMLVALMEETAMECLAGCISKGQTTVGAAVCVEHLNPSPLGATITATATITAVEGRRIDFAVTASDNAGAIGKGTHTRFIVDCERLMAKARARV